MSAVKQTRDVIGIVGVVIGAVGAVRELREAQGKGDRLALVNAIVKTLAVATGAALLIRGMRRKDGDDS